MAREHIKRFKYDVLIEEEDVCDRESEIAELTEAARRNRRIVLLAPRRYGKTSLVKNIVAGAARRFRPRRAVLAADFMAVESLHSIAARLEHGFGKAIAELFSPADIVKKAAGLMRQLSLHVELDTITGAPSVKIALDKKDDRRTILELLDGIARLSRIRPIVLILDEFQDIAFVKEAEGLLRPWLQEMSEASVFLLGSKRHLMVRLFGDANAPLFGYGDEMNLGPIPVASWAPYFAERLEPFGTTVTSEGLEHLIERMCHVPNAICETGHWIQENHRGERIEPKNIEIALDEMVEMKQGYSYRILGTSHSERELLIEIARQGFVKEPHAMAFINRLTISKSSVGTTLKKLMDRGMVEQEMQRGYRLSDPVLAHYLKKLRPI